MTLPPRKWEGAGIRLTARDGALRLAGVRAHASDTSRWPWDEGLTLDVQQGDKQGRVDLATRALWPHLPLSLKPVADDDALVTFELVHPAEQ